jgi:hypothetical protein
MICAHSSLTCPFCRCRISTWLRYNPDYSKLIIKRETTRTTKKKIIVKRQQQQQQQPRRRYQTSKPKPTRKERYLIFEIIYFSLL